MKSQSPALAAHRAQQTTTMAWCWKVTRTDGQVFGFTSTDTSLVIDGVTYPAATGILPSAAQGSADLAVRNMELQGTLLGEVITEEDVLAGIWDNAAVVVFEVNYLDLSAAGMIIASGTTGEIKTGNLSYVAETRGLAQALQQPIGDTVTPGCTAVLGDEKCGVDVEALRQSFAVTEVTSAREFVASGIAGPDDNFGAGEVTWDTGDNATYRMEVNSSTSLTSSIVLSLPMVHPIKVGDTGTIKPGCRKRATEDCSGRYDNIVRFRGYPHVPGNNRVFGAGGLVGGQG